MSLFGASTPTTTNLFGGGATATAPAATTNLFGTGTAAPAATTGGLFGSTTTPAATTNLFGTSTTTPAATTNLFGTGTTSTTPAATTNLFGPPTPTQSTTPATNSLFGAPTPTQGSTGATTNLFGGATTPLTTLTKTETMGMPPVFMSTVQQMREELQNKNGAQYALNACVYNRSSQPQSKFPTNVKYPPLFEIAMKNNPDPEHLAPQPLQGFDGLEARVEEQKKQAEQNEKELRDAQAYLNMVEKDITTIVESVLPSLLFAYRKLSTELLETVVKLRACAGSSYISADERVIQAKLEDIESVASDPAKVCARLDGLVEQVRSIASTRDFSSSSSSSFSSSSLGASNISRAEIDIFAKHLEQEQRALQTLVESIRECEKMAALLHDRQ